MIRSISNLLIAFLLALFLPLLAHGDGCILKKGGGYVPERNQIAFIEWESGQERLFVATTADQSKEPTVWIIPVPSHPERVTAEPVERFPRVLGHNQLADLRRRLSDIQVDVLWRNTGLPLFLLTSLGGEAKATFSQVGAILGGRGGVTVHAEVERHGMIVQVLTARSTAALDAYLQSKDLGVRPDQLYSLATYIGQEFSLVCAWKTETEATARALRIDFPTQHIYYPMLPTRVYDHPVDTRIFVKGWAHAAPGTKLADMRCERGLWRVRELAGKDAYLTNVYFGPDSIDFGPLVPLTKVVVSSHPREWQSDLYLEVSHSVAPQVAKLLTEQGEGLSAWINVTWGIVLGVLLPFVLIPSGERRWHDWLVLAGIGGLVFFTVIGVGLAVWIWTQVRFPQARLAKKVLGAFFVLLLFAVGMLGVLFAAPSIAKSEIGSVVLTSIVLLAVSFIAIIPMVAGFLSSYRALKNRTGWWVIFAAIHGAAVVLTCQCFLRWLQR